MGAFRWTDEVELAVTAAGASNAVVEAEIALPAKSSGKCIGVKIRRSAGSGTDKIYFFDVDGVTDDTQVTGRRMTVDPSAATSAADIDEVGDPITTFAPADGIVRAIADNDTATATAATWQISLAMELSG